MLTIALQFDSQGPKYGGPGQLTTIVMVSEADLQIRSQVEGAYVVCHYLLDSLKSNYSLSESMQHCHINYFPHPTPRTKLQSKKK